MNSYLGGGGGGGGGGGLGDGSGGRQADPWGDPHGGAVGGATGGGYAADPLADQYGGAAAGAGAGQYPDPHGGAAAGGRTPSRQYAAPPAGDPYGGGQLVSRSGGAANAGQGDYGAQGDPYGMPDNNAYGGGGYDGLPAGGSGAVGGAGGGGGGGLTAQRGQVQQLGQPPANMGGMTMREAETALVYGRGSTSSRSWHGGGNGVKLDQLAPTLGPVLSCPPGHLPGQWHVLGALVLGKNHFSCEGTNHTSQGQCEGQFRTFLMRQCRHRGYNGPAEPGLVMRFVGPWVADIRRGFEGDNRRASMQREPRVRYAEPRPRRLLLVSRRF
ncbi:MAG: hypothetical protein Q9210_002020 [Variospora velana]